MKLVYMGTPEFAVAALEALIASEHEVMAVITQPDKAKGRSKALVHTAVKACALSHNIPVYQPNRVRDEEMVKLLQGLEPDAIVVAAYGQILPESILCIPKYGCINIHASLLPKYRGAAPIEWAIIDGEKKTGVTTMYMEKGLDTGDMIEKAEVEITPDDTGKSLHDKLASAGAKLIITTLDALQNNRAVRIKQNDEESCYASMLTKDMGRIDFNKPAVVIERMIRGLIPWPCAYTVIDGKNVKIYSAEVRSMADIGARGVTSCKAGEIIEINKKSFTIACGEDALVIKSLQPEGKKQMDAASYLNGNKLKIGMQAGK